MILLLLLPLVVSPKAMDPIATSRFMVLAIFLLACVAYLAIRAPFLRLGAPTRLVQILCGVVALFVAVLVASSFAAINKQEALFCTLRWLLVILAGALFARSASADEGKLTELSRVAAIVLAVQSGVALLEFYGIAFTHLPPEESVTPHGLLANRNLLASALVLLLPLALHAALTGGRAWCVVAGIALFLGLNALVAAETRSAWLALAVALVVANVLIAWLALRKRLTGPTLRRWAVAMGGLALGGVLAFGITTALGNPAAVAELHHRLALPTKAAAATPPEEASTTDSALHERLVFWRKSFEMMRDHPALGVGPGNWRLEIPNYVAEGRFATGMVLQDRAHDVYVQLGAETGVLGFAAYLAAWLLLGVIAVRAVLRAGSDDRVLLGLAAVAGLTAFAVDSVFSFPDESILHVLLLAMYAGLAVSLHEATATAPSPEQARSISVPRGALLIPIAMLLFDVWLGSAKTEFEYRWRRANAYKDKHDYGQMLKEVDAGRSDLVTVNPLGVPLEVHSSLAYVNENRLKEGLDEARRGLTFAPRSVRLWNDMGTIYSQQEEWDEAIPCYREALRMAPRFDVALKNLAVAYYNKGMYPESLDAVLQSDWHGDADLEGLVTQLRAKVASPP